MIELIPKSWASWNFEVREANETIAEITSAMLKEAAEVEVKGVCCRFFREKAFKGAFVLEADGHRLVEARKPSFWRKRFDMSIGDHTYSLRPETWYGRAYLLERDGETLGAIRPKRLLSRKATVDLPDYLPAGIQVFVAWLVIIMWKRDAAAAAGG